MKTQLTTTDISPDAIARRLVAERKRLGLQQDEVRKALGVAYATMSRYENGHRMPEAQQIGKLATLGFDVNYVITGQRPSLCTTDLSADEQAWLELYHSSTDKIGLNKLVRAYISLE